MNKFATIKKPAIWSTSILLAAIVAGCGGGGGGVAPSASTLGPTGATCSSASCVNLGTAANYVILDEATVTFTPVATTTTTPTITGNIGLSPAAASYITGFSLVADATNTFSRSTQVTGKIYASDYAPPTPANLTTAVADKNTAYTAAAGMALAGGGQTTACPGAGAFGNLTITPGVYKCAVNVGIATATNLTLTGSATDVWVFEITGTLTQAAATQVTMAGGALPQNVFWQVSNGVSIGSNAHIEGVIMSATNIQLITGATVKGRLLARTGVLMDSNTVTQP